MLAASGPRVRIYTLGLLTSPYPPLGRSGRLMS